MKNKKYLLSKVDNELSKKTFRRNMQPINLQPVCRDEDDQKCTSRILSAKQDENRSIFCGYEYKIGCVGISRTYIQTLKLMGFNVEDKGAFNGEDQGYQIRWNKDILRSAINDDDLKCAAKIQSAQPNQSWLGYKYKVEHVGLSQTYVQTLKANNFKVQDLGAFNGEDQGYQIQWNNRA